MLHIRKTKRAIVVFAFVYVYHSLLQHDPLLDPYIIYRNINNVTIRHFARSSKADMKIYCKPLPALCENINTRTVGKWGPVNHRGIECISKLTVQRSHLV